MMEETIKWEFRIGEKCAEVIVSKELGAEELEVAKDMLEKLMLTRINGLKLLRNNKLPITADIDSLYPELSVRTRNVLKRAGCNTIEDVLNHSLSDIARMRNMGKNAYNEVKERFGKYGKFAGETDEAEGVIE